MPWQPDALSFGQPIQKPTLNGPLALLIAEQPRESRRRNSIFGLRRLSIHAERSASCGGRRSQIIGCAFDQNADHFVGVTHLEAIVEWASEVFVPFFHFFQKFAAIMVRFAAVFALIASLIALLRSRVFLAFTQRGALHENANALHGEGRRLSVRAVKAAGCAFIGAKRRALTGEADGAGAGFSQEGQRADRTSMFDLAWKDTGTVFASGFLLCPVSLLYTFVLMLDQGVWAEVKVGNEHLRLFAEHNAQGVQASVYNVIFQNMDRAFGTCG
jgi:hypothetical protein